MAHWLVSDVEGIPDRTGAEVQIGTYHAESIPKTQAWGECVWMSICLGMYARTLRLSFESVLCGRTPWLTLEWQGDTDNMEM